MDNQKKFEARRAVGRRVSLMRKTLGLSVAGLAEHAGIPRQYVYDLEGGIRVSVTNVFAVAKAMRVSTDYILGLAEEPFYQSVTHGCCHVAARVDAFNRLRGVAYYKTADGSMMPGERVAKVGSGGALRDISGADVELERCGHYTWKGESWKIGESAE